MTDYAIVRLNGVQVGIADVTGEDASPGAHRVETNRVILDGSRLPLSEEGTARSVANTPLLFAVGEVEDLRLCSFNCGAYKNGVHILDAAVFAKG